MSDQEATTAAAAGTTAPPDGNGAAPAAPPQHTAVGPTEAAAPAAGGPAAPEDARLRGVSRSIIIGVGGTGVNVVLDVRRRLLHKYGSLDRIPIVDFLVIDTDQAVLAKNPNFPDEANLPASGKIHTSVNGVDTLREKLNDYPHLRSWLDPYALSGDINQGAGAIRARGRVAYFWNYAAIARKVEAMYHQVTRAESVTKAINTGLRVGEGVTVYIVASLLGGTGSGMFLDLAYTIREKLGRQANVDTVGIFTIPPNSEAVAVDNRPNAYAALLELNHYTDGSTVFEAQYGPSLPPMRNQDPPFRYCYLVDMSNPQIQLNSVSELTEMIGLNIFLDLTSEFQRQKKSNRDNFNQYLIVPDKLGVPQNFLSMGLAAIHFPKEKVITACASRLARSIVNGWMTPLDRSVNIPAFTDQQLDRLGLTVEHVARQLMVVNSDSGESLYDTVTGYWTGVNRQYQSHYPGHDAVAAFLQSRERAFAENFVDNDPNPDLLLKRRENMGEFPRQIQLNLGALIPAKRAALVEEISRIVNNPAHRHTVAQQFLQTATDRAREFIATLQSNRETAGNNTKPMEEARDRLLADIQRFSGDMALTLIPGAKRRSIDESETEYVSRARQASQNRLDDYVSYAAQLFFERLLETLKELSANLDRYVALVRELHGGFAADEYRAVIQPVQVNGEVIFDPGRRVVDDHGQETYVDGDIDHRYSHYTREPAVVNATAQNTLAELGLAGNIYGLRDTDLGRARTVLFKHCRNVFQGIEEESVLQKFFEKYPDPGKRAEILKKVNDLSAPFIHLPRNAPGYEHFPNKENTVIGVINGAKPQTEYEAGFYQLLKHSIQNLQDQFLANNAEQNEVLILRERAAFPLRLLQNLPNYKYAYEQARMQGATANPMHIRRDVREWLRIDPPSIEDQKRAWQTFVVAWASGIIAEQTQKQYTNLGEQTFTTYSVTYTDNYGMPKTDILGRLGEARKTIRVQGFEDEDNRTDPTLPPVEMRQIVLRLCDDRNLHQQIQRAIERRIEEMGVQQFGDLLLRHSRGQHGRLSFYDSYYLVLAGNPDPARRQVGYFEYIGYNPALSMGAGAEGGWGDGAGQTTVLPPATPLAVAPVAAPAPSAPQLPAAAPAGSIEDRLAKLKSLLDKGLITQEKYQQRMDEILAEV